ncbi:MAG: PQQ-binding-like beta-propeller repeat protein, partial [Thermoplasmata archaeon]|nr:PQQ-binding-like beta-propeller repeat protein [Thermoplasmata archaeon]
MFPLQSVPATSATVAVASSCPGTNWPTYLGSVTRQGSELGERTLSPANASRLTELWNYSTGRPVAANPAIVGGVVYVGSWNGDEYAIRASTGALLWKSFLGIDPKMKGALGITSSATVSGGVVYVGGGNSSFYALNASTGKMLWRMFWENVSSGYYNWASPLIEGGNAYLGVSSLNDAAVRGALLEVSLSTHKTLHEFFTIAKGDLGATVWTSPAYDALSGSVFVTTGNPPANNSSRGESILMLNATSLTLKGSWAVPTAEVTLDGDMASTPVLFTTRAGAPMVSASDKDGRTFAWNRSHLSAGPLWNQSVAVPSNLTHNGNLGPMAYGGGMLFVGTTLTNLSGVLHNASVQAFVAGTGAPVWATPLDTGVIQAAPVYANGVVVVGAGPVVYVLNASNGIVLYHYLTHTKVTFWGPGAISRGEF